MKNIAAALLVTWKKLYKNRCLVIKFGVLAPNIPPREVLIDLEKAEIVSHSSMGIVNLSYNGYTLTISDDEIEMTEINPMLALETIFKLSTVSSIDIKFDQEDPVIYIKGLYAGYMALITGTLK